MPHRHDRTSNADRAEKPGRGALILRSSHAIAVLCVASFLLSAAVAWGVFEAVPRLEDEHINLYQAKVFASGRITQPTPPQPEAFFVPFQINQQGQIFSKYPPGYSLLLAIGVLVGQPWLVNALTAGLGLLGVYLLAKDLFDPDTGLLAAALAAVSPMYIMLSGTLLSHSSNLTILVFFAWAFLRAARERGSPAHRYAWLAGGLMGLALTIRPWTALGVGLPFAVGALVIFIQDPRETFPVFARMALAFLVVGSLWPIYNLVATGSPLTNTYQLYWPYDTVGFGPGHGPNGHTLANAWRNLNYDLPYLAETLLGWPQLQGVSLTWLTVALGLLWLPWKKSEWLLLLPAIALTAAQLAYWAPGGGLYGARYHAEIAPFLWILAARGLLKLGDSRVPRVLIKVALPALIAWVIFFSLMPRFEEGRDLYDISREDARTIEAAGLTDALVFVRTEVWTDYARLSWLNEPCIDESDVIFAQDLGRWSNRTVMLAYPDRSVYHYNRYAVDPLVPLNPISDRQ